MRISFEHRRHPHIEEERKKAGPPKTSAAHLGINSRVALGIPAIIG